MFVRQALCAIELLARAPGQGLEPRPPRSERGVLAVRRSRKETIGCSCHSPTLRPWIAAASPLPRVVVEAFWSPALACAWKCAGKSSRHMSSFTYRIPASEDLSLSGGASIQFSVFFKLSITSLIARFAFKTTKATLSGRPRFELLCRCTSSGSTSERGPGYRRTAANRRATVGTTCRSRHRPRPS